MTAATIEAPTHEAPTQVTTFTPRDAFELAQREAKAYAGGDLVPARFQGNVSNCLIAMNMAKRIGADPLMTMQSLYIVHGNPSWSAQFLIATFNQCGKYTAMRYEFKGGEGKDDYGCRAFATEKATGEKISGPWVTWKMVRAEGWDAKNGSKWKTMPDLMFTYRAAAFLIRTHAPEIAMGLRTVEEVQDMVTIDVTPQRGDEAASSGAIDRVKEQLRKATSEPIDVETGEVKTETETETVETTMEYATVLQALTEAASEVLVDVAADLIPAVQDEHQRNELTKVADRRRRELRAAAK